METEEKTTGREHSVLPLHGTSGHRGQGQAPHSLVVRTSACILYGAASIAMMLCVKVLMTEMKFRSFLFISFTQQVATVILLLCSQVCRPAASRFPLLTRPLFLQLLPLSLLFCLNVLSSLYATRDLSMPCYVLFRFFSVAFTMVAEHVVLNRSATFERVFPVCLLIISPFIASHGSWKTDWKAITAVMINNVLTALQGVVLRERIDALTSVISADGIMFYNGCALVLLTFSLLYYNVMGEQDFVAQYSFTLCSSILLAVNSVMGFLLIASMYYCTKVTSPLTTSVVGGTKNVIVSFAGMLLSDYTFSFSSLAGILLSALGTLLYSSETVMRHAKQWIYYLPSAMKRLRR